MAGDLAAATFDPNVWYHVTEGRVDNYSSKAFTSSFQVTDSNGTVKTTGFVKQFWQFQPVADTKGRYFLRNSQTSVLKQLGVCYVPTEIANSKTQPCMRESNGSEEQQWDIADWGDKTMRFINVANGTDYVMDVHPGNPMFMSDQLDTKVVQPAQHWLMTSTSNVNDGAFSTTFTNLPSSATSAATTDSTSKPTSVTTGSSSGPSATSGSGSSSSSSSGLSTGATAGIGVGVALGVIALVVVGFLLWRRRRKNGPTPPPAAETHNPEEGVVYEDKKPASWAGQYHQTQQTSQPMHSPPQELASPEYHAELDSTYHAELDNTEVGNNTMHSPEMRKPSPGQH